MANTVRIGFDDVRAREIVSADFVMAGFTNTIVGIWKPGERAVTTDAVRLRAEIARIAADIAAGSITIHEATIQVQRAAYGA